MAGHYQENDVLRMALQRDRWEADEACLFFMGFWKVRNNTYHLETGEKLKAGIGRRGSYSSPEPSADTKIQDEAYSDLLGRWDASDHIKSFRNESYLWDKNYCLAWGEKNGLIDRLEKLVSWGVDRSLIDPERLEGVRKHKDWGIAKPDALPSEKELKNRLRLIGVMADILSSNQHKQRFSSAAELKGYIEANYGGHGLSQRTLDSVFREAKKLVERK